MTWRKARLGILFELTLYGGSFGVCADIIVRELGRENGEPEPYVVPYGFPDLRRSATGYDCQFRGCRVHGPLRQGPETFLRCWPMQGPQIPLQREAAGTCLPEQGQAISVTIFFWTEAGPTTMTSMRSITTRRRSRSPRDWLTRGRKSRSPSR